MSGNYENVRAEWRQRFLKMDHESLAERFHLRMDDGNLYLTYFSRPCAIDRRTGIITRLDKPDAEIGFNQEMNFFNMFHYAVEHPVPSGKLVPFRNVKRVYPFEAAYMKTIIHPFERAFTGRATDLQRALETLHARPIPQGDAGGELEIFPGLRLAVTFWDADDEFPAQANMLFDSAITDFMHEENVVCVASDAARFLVEEAGGDEETAGRVSFFLKRHPPRTPPRKTALGDG